MARTYNPKLFNPLYWHIKKALRDENIRYIYVEGGSSASKTFSICQALLFDQYEHEYSSMVFRRQHIDIEDSVYSSFNMAADSLSFKDYYRFQQDLIKSKDGKGSVRFRGLDNEENIKGIEKFNVVYLNEWSQFLEVQWGQARKRLRGRKNQKFICDWNPIDSGLWQYKEWIDKDEWIDLPLDIEDCPSKYSSLNTEYAFKRINKAGNSIWIKVTYRDNFWIVGHPSGSGGMVDEHVLADFESDRILKPNLYRIYANGERGIRRTGGEFWKQFREDLHCKDVPWLDDCIHVSVDSNVTPYVTQQVWQVDAINLKLGQFDEIICRPTDNSAKKAAKRLIKWMQQRKYENVIYVYGDPSLNARTTVDENNASFFEKYIEVLEDAGYHIINRVNNSAPRVQLSGEFINEIYESGYDGWQIEIGKCCTVSIEDYVMTKEAKDGTILKKRINDKETGQSYEQYGHCSDTKRYFICTILHDEYEAFANRNRKKITYL
jgi:phage terminase large subunit